MGINYYLKMMCSWKKFYKPKVQILSKKKKKLKKQKTVLPTHTQNKDI